MSMQLPMRDIRLVLRAGAVLEGLGLTNFPVKEAIHTTRRRVCQEIGLRQYVFDVLGGNANKRVENVILFRDGVRLEIPRKWAQTSLADYLAGCFEPDSLPDKVVIGGIDKDQTLQL